MKKKFIIFLIIVSIFTLVSCSNETNKSESSIDKTVEDNSVSADKEVSQKEENKEEKNKEEVNNESKENVEENKIDNKVNQKGGSSFPPLRFKALLFPGIPVHDGHQRPYGADHGKHAENALAQHRQNVYQSLRVKMQIKHTSSSFTCPL